MSSRKKKRNTHKFSINDKEFDAQYLIDESPLGEHDPRLTHGWVSLNGHSQRNAHPALKPNAADHGFNHLNIPAPLPIYLSDPINAPDFSLPTPPNETSYIHLLAHKLQLAKTLILKEHTLNLDPNCPGTCKSASSQLLSDGPIRLDRYCQQRLRLLMASGDKLRELAAATTEQTLELSEEMEWFRGMWIDLQMYVALQMPGAGMAERETRADGVLADVFEKLVDE